MSIEIIEEEVTQIKQRQVKQCNLCYGRTAAVPLNSIIISPGWIGIWFNESKVFDLCPDCAADLKVWMRENYDIKTP